MITMLERGKDADPLYIQVANILRANIQRGEWRDGDMIPPETTLCAQFDIARGTLRQALQILEREGYLYREQGRGTFIRVPEQEGSSRFLAFVVPYIRDSSVSAILVGFQRVAEEAGYPVIFHHVNNSVAQQQDVLQKLARQGVSGVALYPVDSESTGVIDAMVENGYPLVLVDRYLKALCTDYVMADHFGGALQATHYLLDRGHQRVGFVTWLSPAISMDHRLLGYRQALSERGIPEDERLLVQVEGYPTVDRTPLIAYLSNPDRPTAVFAANDQIAIALYRSASVVGLNIPRDLSVIGFDNLDTSANLDPPLTTIAQPFTRIGQEAAQVLIERIQGQSGKARIRQITLGTEVVERESCMALRSTRAAVGV